MVNKNIPIFWYASLGSVALHPWFVSWMQYVMSRFQPTLVIPRIVELANYNQIVKLELELQQAC